MLPRNHVAGLRRLSFAIEIAVVIAIKLLLLFWLWHTFFSAPQTKKMRLPTEQVEQHLLSDALPIPPLPYFVFI